MFPLSLVPVCATALAGLSLILFMALRRLRRQRDALLQEKDVVFGFIHDVGELFAESDSVELQHLLKRVLHYALRTTHAGAGALYLVDSQTDQLRARAVSGVFAPLDGPVDEAIHDAFSKTRYVEEKTREQRVAMGDGLVGRVAADGVPLLIADAERDRRIPRYPYDYLQIHSLLLVPMRFHHTVLGVLAVINKVDGEPFVQTDVNLLQAMADQASVAVYYARFSEALDEKRRLDADLNVAQHIQSALLPKSIPSFPGVELAAFSEPAREVGGDYYDVVRIDEQHIGIAIADVSGKGVAAALIMALCRGALQIHAPGECHPAAVLRAINATLIRDLADDFFVTMAYLVYHCDTRELTVARAGHVAPIVFPAGGGKPVGIESAGMAIGIDDDGDLFNAALTETTVQLGTGDVVLIVTDGVTEAMDAGENEWGVLNLVKTAQMTLMDHGSAGALAHQIRQRLLQFVGDAPQYDDMTLVTLRVTAPDASQEEKNHEAMETQTESSGNAGDARDAAG